MKEVWGMKRTGLVVLVIVLAVVLSSIGSASAVPATDKAHGKNLVPGGRSFSQCSAAALTTSPRMPHCANESS